MAVPSAVTRKREKLEAEYAAMNIDTSSPPPPDAPITVQEVAVPQAQPVGTTNDPRDSRIAELEQLLKTRDGQASQSMRELNEMKSRFDMVASQISALEEANTQLAQQKETAEAFVSAKRANDALPSLDDVPDISPEELEQFGDSVNFVKKLSKRELLAYVKPLVEEVRALKQSLARLSDLDRLPQLETSLKNVQADNQRVKDEEFFRTEVLAYFPDFIKVRGSQEWKDYLAMDVPDKGYKIGHMLNHYRSLHDAANLRSILQVFYDRTSSRPNLSSLTVPSKTQTEGTVVTKPTLKASEYRAKLDKFIMRKMPKAEWIAYKTEFDTAMAEGRVEHDARL